MRKAIITTITTAVAVAAIIITPLAIDGRPARILLLVAMGGLALAVFADAAMCHARHCRAHRGLLGSEARHAA